MESAGLNPHGLPKRLRQELAAHRALREQAAGDLRKLAKEADARREKALKLMEILRPPLEQWVAAQMPDSPKMEKAARTYMRAVDALHEAEVAMAVAEDAVRKQAEQEQAG